MDANFIKPSGDDGDQSNQQIGGGDDRDQSNHDQLDNQDGKSCNTKLAKLCKAKYSTVCRTAGSAKLMSGII